ncbi:STAS domain-containing protein [Gordonia sp. NPDC062954]|uniref:STAS domain-containing protein n=1 Tax=unclassified Gordonia (in: high G+C Gram-positive bacteria) TaxID=2657482 RepID=UPI000C58F838|nr:STAS domain-containing protein [Gordonia sp. (in: high G+C Gram-positive bacteria)]MAU83344.1 hypothetical protein [Gordonia sp. (in: high G+C Gram-positive bacteria)]
MTIAPFPTDDQSDTIPAIDVFDVIGSAETPRQHTVPLYEFTVERRSAGTVWLRVTGEIDLAACGDLQRAMTRAGAGYARVIVDLADVSFMSPRAVGTIAEHPLVAAGRVDVVAPARATRLLFDLFGAGGLVVDTR